MWSGPRNLSTSMMYSFGNRIDTTIVDEPYYAAYLHYSGVVHPMNEEILNSQPWDPDLISAGLTKEPLNGFTIWYQKLMTHHMLPEFSLDWIAQQENVFLIRHPARVIASYAKKRGRLTLDDLGFAQQKRIFERCLTVCRTPPIVIDSDDILEQPKVALGALCAVLGIEFDSRMLNWPSGARQEDGVWAPHWYDAVHKSTEFGSISGPVPTLAVEFDEVLRPAMEIYAQLSELKLRF